MRIVVSIFVCLTVSSVAALAVAGPPTLTCPSGCQEQINALEARIAALESLLMHVSRDGDEITITGANLHVVNGTGTTAGTPNGLGNVIIGYNELRGGYCPGNDCDDRTGSHMLVAGEQNNYSSFGGIVVGRRNWTGDPSAPLDSGYASVSGGWYNFASNRASSVSGGYGNTASGYYSSVSGGEHNTASYYYASVSGGYANIASGTGSSVSGGYHHTASGYYASVSGGYYNTASGYYSSVSGGQQRSVTGDYDWRAGSLLEDF